MAKTLQLAPGYLVGLSMGVDGGVTYERIELGAALDPNGAEIIRYQTTRITPDPEEFKAATQVRLKARGLVRSACTPTPFGLVCPKDDLPKVEQAIATGKEAVDAFNATAKTCKVRMAYLLGEIAKSESEAVASVRAEIQALLQDLEAATQEGDVKGIRDICDKASSMSKMLAQKTEGRDALSKAIAASRKVAREVVKRVQKQGEALAAVLEQANVSPIAVARFAFSDEAEDMSPSEQLPEVDLGRFADLEDADA